LGWFGSGELIVVQHWAGLAPKGLSVVQHWGGLASKGPIVGQQWNDNKTGIEMDTLYGIETEIRQVRIPDFRACSGFIQQKSS
jgi:hypothetical protein